MEEWRIFLSYRGDSASDICGKDFEENFYNFLMQDPSWLNKYGKIYFSPASEPYENYATSIPRVMETVEFFIMPLTENYFDGFWDEKNNIPNEDSITYQEIKSAMQNDCKFVCIAFPGFSDDIDLYTKLFGEKQILISCAKKIKYDENKKTQLFEEISAYITSPDYKAIGAYDLLNKDSANVLLQTKKQTEDNNRYPFYRKLQDVKRITLMNYASTAFLSGVEIASFYDKSDYLVKWFKHRLISGEIEANIILTDPFCFAAQDAALYKMYPLNKKDTVRKEDIILKNITKLYEFKREFPQSKIKLYLTRIALPYGIMLTEHNDAKNNHMKIDIYSAVTNDDSKRPSFYMLENNESTTPLYNFFKDNINSIIEKSARYDFKNKINCFSDKSKPIIRSGVTNKNLIPNTERSFIECLKQKLPIEVNLLFTEDQKVLIGNDEQNIKQYGIDKPLSKCTALDIKKINKNTKEDKILYLEEFLNLIAGRIPILFELETSSVEGLSEVDKKFIESVIKKIEDYLHLYSEIANKAILSSGLPVAIHSANSDAIKYIKKLNCMLPCGLITANFAQNKKLDFTKVILPDFICCNTEQLGGTDYLDIINEYNLPIIVWTINIQEERDLVFDLCNNIIQEGLI